jgi:hypothetical protein
MPPEGLQMLDSHDGAHVSPHWEAPLAQMIAAGANPTPGRFHHFFAALSTRSACDAVRAPSALAFPLSGRALRHVRTARISWW